MTPTKKRASTDRNTATLESGETFTYQRVGRYTTPIQKQESAGAQLDRRTRENMTVVSGRTYSEAMRMVLMTDPDLKVRFAMETTGGSQ